MNKQEPAEVGFTFSLEVRNIEMSKLIDSIIEEHEKISWYDVQ